MAESFSLQVERTIDDYSEFRRQVTHELHKRSLYRSFNWACGAVAFVVVLALFKITLRTDHFRGPAEFLLFISSFYGIWWLLLWILSPLVERRFYPSLHLFCAPVTIELNDAGIQINGDLFSQSFQWAALSDVTETTTQIFLRCGGGSVAVIPKRAFTPVSKSSDFITAMRDRIVRAKTVSDQSL